MGADHTGWVRFNLALTAFLIAVAGITAYTLWLLRSDAIGSSMQVSALMARSFENFLTQSIQSTELGLANSVGFDRETVDLRASQLDLDRLLRRAPHLRSLSIIDADDRILISSNPANVGKRVPTQDYLPMLEGASAALRIGSPWMGRDFNAGRPATLGIVADSVDSLIPVIQPIMRGGGRLRMLVAFNPDYFVNQMLQTLDASSGHVDVLRLDGIRLMSTRLDDHSASSNHAGLPSTQLSEREFGQYEYEAGDGRVSLTAFRVSSLYPFVVVSHLRQEVALQGWYTEVKTILGIVVPSSLLVTGFAIGFFRRHRSLKDQQAESARLQRINAAFVFDNTREGIIIVDANTSITDVNAAFTRITGYSREEALGKNPSFLRSGRHDKAFYENMWQELKDNGHWSGEVWNRRKDGEVFAEMLTISAVTNSKWQVQQYVAVFSNITAMKTYQHELEHIARYDALTALPNRVLLADRLGQAMNQALRRKNLLGLLFIDLDGFKAVNDTYGHEAGDQVLITVARRMGQVLRDGDTLARNGGDEFVAVMVDLQSPSDAEPLLNRLLGAASEPIEFNGLQLQVTASVGVSFYPQFQPIEAEVLMRQADKAMYKAKLLGKNCYVFHPTPMPTLD